MDKEKAVDKSGSTHIADDVLRKHVTARGARDREAVKKKTPPVSPKKKVKKQ